MAASVKLEAMAGIVGNDLLLGFFEMRFHIVTHTDPDIGYTCHGDSSLYVVIPVTFVLHLKYDR